MKRQVGFLIVVTVLFAVSMSVGGVKRIKNLSGSIAVSLGPALDTQTFVGKKDILSPASENEAIIYDKLVGSIHMENMVGGAGAGNQDTMKYTLIATKNYRIDTLATGSLIPGAAGTANFEVYRGQTHFRDTSATGVALNPIPDTAWMFLALDEIHLIIYVMDSSGTDPDDTSRGTVNWWFRLVEED